jgi:hypothetical protein
MDPISIILTVASLAGGILGKKKKYIDPEWLKQHFGATAVSEEAMNMFNTIINSPHGQAIMANAQENGQAFSREIAKKSAMAGLSGGGAGADTGTGIFATSAAQGAGDAFARQERGNIYQSVLPAAQQMVSDRMSAYINDQHNGGSETNAGRTWAGIGEAAGTIGSMYSAGKKTSAKPISPELQIEAKTPLQLSKQTAPILPTYLRKNRQTNSFGNVQYQQ